MISVPQHIMRRHQRDMRRTWWLGFVGGLLAAAAVLWFLEPIATGQWHLL